MAMRQDGSVLSSANSTTRQEALGSGVGNTKKKLSFRSMLLLLLLIRNNPTVLLIVAQHTYHPITIRASITTFPSLFKDLVTSLDSSSHLRSDGAHSTARQLLVKVKRLPDTLEMSKACRTESRSSTTQAVINAETRIRRHLQRRRPRHSLATLSVGSEEPSKYVLSDEDIRDLVAIAMDALRQSFVTPSSTTKDTGRDGLVEEDSPKPVGYAYSRHSITPCLSPPVDPATTISMPRASFALTDASGTRLSSAVGMECVTSTKPTIVSKGTIPEIAWAESLQSSSRESSASGTWRSLLGLGLVARRSTARRKVEDEQGQKWSRPGQVSRQQSTSTMKLTPTSPGSPGQDSSFESRMTFFPELEARSCTRDWLKPPVRLEQLTRNPDCDLYGQGVDAHIGKAPVSPMKDWESSASAVVRCDEGMFDGDPFQRPCIMLERRDTQPASPINIRRGRNSLGAAAYLHRHVPASAALSFSSTLWNSQDGASSPGSHGTSWTAASPQSSALHLPLRQMAGAGDTKCSPVCRSKHPTCSRLAAKGL